jgi:DNA-directed RNA polymerase subunit beta
MAVKRIRKNFGKIKKIIEIPDLIGIQKDSYARFLQMDVDPERRRDIGLQAVFQSVFPIKDFTGSASLEFVSYSFAEIKNSIEECIQRGTTYEVPLKLKVRLVVYDTDQAETAPSVRDIKEQEIYFGTLPLMTDKGTFIINGTERVTVSQLHRSSGVFFDHDKGKTHTSGKLIYSSRIIPVRGSWIDMEIDPKDIIYIRIDRRRKFPLTLLLKAFGYSNEDLLAYYYDLETIVQKDGCFFKLVDEVLLKGQKASKDIADPITGDVMVKKGKVINIKAIKRLKTENVEMIPIDESELIGKISAFGIREFDGDETVIKSNEILDETSIEKIKKGGIERFSILFLDGSSAGDILRKTLMLDKVQTRQEAMVELYRRLRPGNPATHDVAQEFVDHLFFKTALYDLSGVGRLKVNQSLGLSCAQDLRILRREDILATAKHLIHLRQTQGTVDDIDHLGNRRVRAVGELLENQYRIGLVRMERAIKERMSLQDIDAIMPNDLVNPKPVSAVIKEFFGTSQLSQFMDQTNPLSETTHKRRLSALGPGGLTRERAGFEVRDVHPSHYGRICPIETPEGPNIGLIVSLSSYACVNEYGFIETPYRVVRNGQVTGEIRFLSAFDEKKSPIAQANAELTADGHFAKPSEICRVEGEFTVVPANQIELMDISPNQLVSVSASLIPFLENDDANRALMGSNMQRQAVPLLVNEAPLVGTGIEGVVARDSGIAIVTSRDGVVEYVDSSRIIIKHSVDSNGNDSPVTIYRLNKFIRSNQGTCFNHRPIVRQGQIVRKGDVIADGPATDHGELALGKNVTVAFMPWGGYNFEDSILVSERLVREGVYTSIHIEEFEVVSRDTKLGKEEITRDIPNVGEEALRNLDESGIVRLGAEVVPGDILVGKITPKGETQLSPEEKLLRAIFGEKAGDVKDTSLRVPPGIQGIVIDAKVFTRRGSEKDDRTRKIEDEEIAALERDLEDERRVLEAATREKLEEILIGQVCTVSLKRGKRVLVPKGETITSEMLDEISPEHLEGIVLTDTERSALVHQVIDKYLTARKNIQEKFEKSANRYEKGDDLAPGVIKMVKVYVAMKRKLSVGDKMAGRHGNKGVVSCILPEEDLPYFEDGTPVDMILNPLGVPSRMNVGQVLEIHLGYAAKGLGWQIEQFLQEQRLDLLKEKYRKIFSTNTDEDQAVIGYINSLSDEDIVHLSRKLIKGVPMATPVFDGANELEIKNLLEEAGLPRSGQTTLYDGKTGEPFRQRITVGTMYMLKLHHLVDDKIHARSIGPYSLVTQQPLGGKAQFGGQRLGEMEVWAMEAYGAANTLQEFLTVKSDDMAGRTRMYEKIVKGKNTLEPGIPESFRVLTSELKALGLDITLLEEAPKISSPKEREQPAA